MKKQGQVQNLETVLVIAMITIIIGIALVVFYNFNSASLQNQKQQYQQLAALNLLQTLPHHPQLQYTELGYDKAAIDAAKLLAANLSLSGRMKVTIQQVYPEAQDVTCSRETYPDCTTYIIYNAQPSTIRNQEVISLPVNLYHPKAGQQALAVLTITSYT